jgi:hypothetical protein
MSEQRMPDTAAGVALAWTDWLAQHDVSTPDCITEGVNDAVGVWLDAHTEPLIAAIAKAVAEIQRKWCSTTRSEK